MGPVKEDCVFLFLFQPFKCKAYFLALSLMGKNQVTQLETEGLAGVGVASSWLCPATVFCGRCWNLVVGCSSCP